MLLATAVAQHPLGVVSRDVITLHGATVVRDQVEPVGAHDIQGEEQLLGRALVPVVAGSLLGLTVALEVHADVSVLLAQCGHLVVPLVPRVRNAVQKHDRLALPALSPMEANEFLVAVDVDEVG